MSAPSPPSSPRFVKCPGCGARLKVRAEDAGKRAQCHECGKLFRLGGAPAPPLPTTAAARQEPGPPSPPPATPKPINVLDNAHLHPVHCELCQTLMYATDDEVGNMVKCPDCGHRNLVRRREAKRPSPQVLVPDGDEYQLDEDSAPPPVYVFTPIEQREKQFRAAARARLGIREPEVEAEPGVESKLPRGKATTPSKIPESRRPPAPSADPRRPAIPVVQGVLRMMFTSEVMLRWMGLSAVLTVMLFLIWNVVNAVGNAAVMYMPLFAGGCMLTGAWLMSASPLLVAIATQSTDGADELHDPPSWMAFDIAEAAFVVMAVMISVLPAWLAAKAAATLPIEQQLAIAAAVWLAVFPFVILSALEQGSAFAIFSPRVAASLVRCFIPWLVFYVASLLLVAGFGAMAWALLNNESFLTKLPIPWLAVALMLIYMRMIGRLGWWIADVMPPPNEVEEE